MHHVGPTIVRIFSEDRPATPARPRRRSRRTRTEQSPTTRR